MPPKVPDFLEPLVIFTPVFPIEAVLDAIARRDESVPHLIAAISWATEHPTDVIEADYMLHSYAAHILAELREPAALPALLAHFRSERADDILGDELTSDGPRILEAVAGGDLDAIETIATDENADEFAKSAAIHALGIATLAGAISREELSIRLDRLIHATEDHADDFRWDAIASVIGDFRLIELFPAVKGLFQDGRCDPTFCSLDYIEEKMARPFEPDDFNLKNEYGLYQGVIESMQDWHCFHTETETIEDNDDEMHPIPSSHLSENSERPTPVTAAAKPGRNDSCPCGSGKKYKKCCGSKA